MKPRKQAGHMTCTRPRAERQIPLAMRAPSTHDPQPTKLLQAISECGRLRPPTQRQTLSMCTRQPHRGVIVPVRFGQLTRRLFGYSNKYGTGQFAITTDERCVVGLVVLTKNGRWPGVGVFFDQGFVGRASWVKFCTDGGLSIVHQRGFGSNKLLTVIRKDTRVEFGLRP